MDAENGLTLNNLTIEDLVNKDTDGDGILDWEEGLFGTDPTKKETTPGIPDQKAVSKMRAEQGSDKKTTKTNTGEENLTQTEKFSRELFGTIAAASQSGTMDQASIEALSNSLAEKIKNPVVRKVYLLSDLKIGTSENKEAIKTYGDALDKIQKLYTVNYTVLDVLQKFIVDDNNVDTSVLTQLDPIISQTKKVIDTALKTSVPQSLSILHLNVINSLEKLMENLNDIKLYDTDSIVSFGAISQYQPNADALSVNIANLQNAVAQKLNN